MGHTIKVRKGNPDFLYLTIFDFTEISQYGGNRRGPSLRSAKMKEISAEQ